MSLIAPYLLELCNATQNQAFSFGVASRLGALSSTFEVDAAKLIHSLVTFSPAPESLAVEFMQEFAKVCGIQSLVEPVLGRQSDLDARQWALEVLKFLLMFKPEDLNVQLKPIRNLATEYLSHLLIATRNPGGKKTPQFSSHPTPDLVRLRKIEDLLQEANASKKQSALKELIYRRDGYQCPLSGYSFKPPSRYVSARCTHILPFSFYDKLLTIHALETFTGGAVSAESVRANINHPLNAINIEHDAHDSFDQLAWGIEAQEQSGGQWKYIFREIRVVAATIRLQDGDEIEFCQGSDGQVIDPPEPSFCNLRLALSRAMHACGASDIIAELYGDDDNEEAITTQPVYFGGPFVSDDTLLRRLHDKLEHST